MKASPDRRALLLGVFIRAHPLLSQQYGSPSALAMQGVQEKTQVQHEEKGLVQISSIHATYVNSKPKGGGGGDVYKNWKIENSMFNYFPFCCVEFSFFPPFPLCVCECVFSMKCNTQSNLTHLNWTHLPNSGNVTQSLWEPWTYDSHLRKRSKYSFLQHSSKQFSSHPSRSLLEQVKHLLFHTQIKKDSEQRILKRASLCVKNCRQLHLVACS